MNPPGGPGQPQRWQDPSPPRPQAPWPQLRKCSRCCCRSPPAKGEDVSDGTLTSHWHPKTKLENEKQTTNFSNFWPHKAMSITQNSVSFHPIPMPTDGLGAKADVNGHSEAEETHGQQGGVFDQGLTMRGGRSHISQAAGNPRWTNKAC